MKTFLMLFALCATLTVYSQSLQHVDQPVQSGRFSVHSTTETIKENLTLNAHNANGGIFVEMYCSEQLIVRDLLLEHSTDNRLFVTIKDIQLAAVPGVDFYHGHLDTDAPTGHNYYRFRLRTIDGTIYFSEAVLVKPFHTEVPD